MVPRKKLRSSGYLILGGRRQGMISNYVVEEKKIAKLFDQTPSSQQNELQQ